MESEIKSATLDDLNNIQKFNLLLLKELNKNCNQTNNCDWSLSKKGGEYFKERIIQNSGCVFIALINNKIIGYLAGSIQEKQYYRKTINSAEIDSFFVLNKFRRKYVGSQLFKTFIQWCNSKRIKRISVTTPYENIPAIKFYRKQGFADYDLILESIIK
ncbi:hypothetical protein A2331_06500 [Candidatus Falkowbacteria bacterium RIFOXYB2_FULL_34_18]|uniref:N-acetyltransferase domain-containing protein n=1 Tax=Candidatus Falkowbacteria bacterium RIFOXYD2_FULL_34_120 TaxID=1798007 RepID=A0A1F5TRN4_9BACT|nr:MAG: hypothetical protein A2331_06500 [Candidatus Falkowbacteria bacterium RIFOXYB2_FULL_34_18]OGF29558.1 MAG: hypothetical protein A2500_01595 [Candidatus Falkowbacteria bacterium RIFOXYC12_FULL_34_55]OGF37639.1 MAG: hypothetical protein A2466_01805 [Candidatus Falkowbacteria bacterium RIFOXYC2_FULL_34_220]OGF39286.1 MAG: hypothetical protein A2515_01885 [Candidatus Falkowbacteria bacterium RIFOXYD12_FULL_34_57]OGF41424.1 MAG: hypothetical protein A2531_00050 [Candidatus Falkowbacteria bact